MGDTQDITKDASLPLVECVWIVGLYSKDRDGIVLATFPDEEQARVAYENDPTRSKVLWSVQGTNPPKRKLQACYTAPWDKKGLGVATLLLKKDGVDDDAVSQKRTLEAVQVALESGTVPFIPPSRSLTIQNATILSMKAFSGRKTVEFFSAAPLRHQSRCYFEHIRQGTGDANRQKCVALTIDDTPCRFQDPESSELPRVRQLLKEYNAKATFMIVGSWCTEAHREDMISLLQDGHEFANHGMMDRSYEFDTNFGTAVDECSKVICDLQTAASVDNVGVKWFRAPHGRYTQSMADELKTRNLTNVMCDTYASCPIVQDGDFIAQHLTKTCQDGSIILLHMPERHVRTWCLTALQGLLEGLKERDFKVTTLSEMSKLNDELGKCEHPS